MELVLERLRQTAAYTEGILSVNGVYYCDTLEDTVRVIRTREDKIKGYTAIPSGTYSVQMTYSPKFRQVIPEIVQVPWFTGIRIHAGNTAHDTSGCILVGKKCHDGMLCSSRVVARSLSNKIAHAREVLKEPVRITITQIRMERDIKRE